MTTHRPNPRLAKIHRSYTVDEIATLYGAHRNTVRAWIKRGLPTLDDRRPVLVLGRHLRDFLQARREVNKKTCGPGRLYCVRCREPQRPKGGAVRYEPLTETLGNLVGCCPCCDAGLYRRVSEKSLARALGDLAVLQGLDPAESHENGERGAQGAEHIDESHPACINSDFNQDASTHAKPSPR